MNLQEKIHNYGVDKLHYISAFDRDGRPNFLSNQATFRNVEKLFALSNLNIFNSFDDVRGDTSDDGGFKIVLCERNNKYYLYILWVNYNGEVGQFILTEDDPRYNDTSMDGYHDFEVFDTLEAVEAYIKQFVGDLDWCIGMENAHKGGVTSGDFQFYGERLEDFQELAKEEDTGWSHQYCAFLEACYPAYSDYPTQNTILFKGLTKESKEYYFELRANIFRAEYQLYVNKLVLFKHKLLNPVDFEISDEDIQMIIQQIRTNYSITSEKLYVDGIIKYDIRAVLEGRYNQILLKSGFDLEKMTRYVKSYLYKDYVIIDEIFETRLITVKNAEGKGKSKEVRYFKKIYGFNDLMNLLYNQIDDMK